MRAPACLVLWLAGAGLAPGQTGAVTYTLGDCLEIGLRRSGVAANARRDYEIAGSKVAQAAAEAVPRLHLSASYTRLDEVEDITVGDMSFSAGSEDNYSAGFTVSQLLYSGGRVGAALNAARLSRGLAASTEQEVLSALARDIVIGFYDVLLARAAVAVHAESVRQLSRFSEQVEEELRHDEASEFDALTARVRLANEEPKLIRARNALELSREGFRRLVNLGDGPFELAGELADRAPQVRLEALLELALERRAVLRRQAHVVALREQDVRAARSGYLPELRAFFGYTGANSYEFVSFQDEWEWHWNAGASLEWDLWDGGLTRGLQREKQLELAKARTDLDELTRSVKLEVRQAFLDLQHAREAMAATRENVALARRALAIAETRYRSGLATYLEFTDSNLALSTARLSAAQACRDHLAARAQLEHACGLRPDGTPRESFDE